MDLNVVISDYIIPIIILVIGIVIVITLILKKVYNHIKEENDKLRKEEAKLKKYEDIDTTVIYKEMNLAKVSDADSIKSSMFDMYKALIKAYCNQDKKLISKFTNENLYNIYLTKIQELTKKRQLEVIKNITLNDIRILDIKKHKDEYTIKFYLNVNCYAYKIDKKYKYTVHGFDDRKVNQELLIYLEKGNDSYVISKITNVGQKTLSKEKRTRKKKVTTKN